MTTAYEHWKLCEEGHLATLTLDRPETSNGLHAAALYELQDISRRLNESRHIWVVILQGQGKHFSTGMEVDVIRERIDQPEHANRAFLQSLQRCLDEFEALKKPTIAKLQGFCIGAGLILALCCDFRVASQRTIFSLPEVRLGLGVIMGTQRITRVAGPAATKEMVLLGKRFKADQALSYGLVHWVVPAEELDDFVSSLGNRFLALAPRTVAVAKRMINQGQELSLRQSQDLEIDCQAELLGSPDLREAVESYVERRRPRFTGE